MSGARRSARQASRTSVDYKVFSGKRSAHRHNEDLDYMEAIASGKDEIDSSEEELNYSDTSYHNVSDEDLEEGQIKSDDQMSEDEEISQCVENRDVAKLRRILMKRKEDCSKLEKAMKEEKEKE